MQNDPNHSRLTPVTARLLVGLLAVAVILAIFATAVPLGVLLLLAAVVAVVFLVQRLAQMLFRRGRPS